MAHLPLDKAYLVALWLEAILYGINFVLFWSCLFISAYNKKRMEVNKLIVGAVVLQYFLSTANVSLGLGRLVIGFIHFFDHPTAYFSVVRDPLRMTRALIITVNSVIAYSVLVWRCYHVWGKSWTFAAVPTAFVVATAVCGIGQVISFARARLGSDVSSPEVLRWNAALYATLLATSVVCMVFIAVRTWTLLRLRASGPATYSLLFTAVIESGMIYSVVLIIGLVLYAVGFNAFYIVYEQFGQITSIVSTSILLLVGLRLTTNEIHSNLSQNAMQTLALHQNRRATSRNTSMSGTVDIVEIISSANYNSEYDLKIVSRKGDKAHGHHGVV